MRDESQAGPSRSGTGACTSARATPEPPWTKAIALAPVARPPGMEAASTPPSDSILGRRRSLSVHRLNAA
jgi:hypothetical protein